MEIIMEKEEDISLKMVAHTAAVGIHKKCHIKEHLDKERKMERVPLK